MKEGVDHHLLQSVHFLPLGSRILYKHFSRSMGETSFQRLNEAVQIMQAGLRSNEQRFTASS